MHSSISLSVPDLGMPCPIRNELRGSGMIQVVNMVLTEEVLSGLFCLCTYFVVFVHPYISMCILLARMTFVCLHLQMLYCFEVSA